MESIALQSERKLCSIIVSYEFIEDDLQITVVSDLITAYKGSLSITLSEFKGIEKILSWNQEVNLAPNESKVVLTIPKEGLPQEENQLYSYLQLTLNDENGIRTSKNIYFKPFKEIVLPRPNLSFQAECDKSNILYLTVKSDHFAKGVYVTCASNNNFSENFFDMPINGEKTISIQLDPLSDVDTIISSIQVRSLWDSMR